MQARGPRIAETDRGPAVRVPMAGGEALLPVPPQVQDTREFRSGRVKHVMVAVMEGVADGPDAAIAADYVRWIAMTQIAGGAAYLDLNVDEISPDVDGRLAADGLAGPDRRARCPPSRCRSIRPTPR